MTEENKTPPKSIFQNITKEEIVLRRIFDDPVLQNKILPHLDPEIFDDKLHKILCRTITNSYTKYKKFPQAMDVSLSLPDNSPEKNKLVKIMNLDLKTVDRDVCINAIENFFKEKKTEHILIKT